jgi:hypothetical protein
VPKAARAEGPKAARAEGAPAEPSRAAEGGNRRAAAPLAKTADFGGNGTMRVDYVLPSEDLSVVASGIFWPSDDDPRARWAKASDHRLVWIEVRREGDGG